MPLRISFGALSLFSLSFSLSLSLSLSHTHTHTHILGHLDFSWSTLALDQERKRRKEEGRSKQGKAGSSSYNKILCRYQFSCVFSLWDLTCIVLHVVLCYYEMGFSRCDNVFSLALPILDNHGVMLWLRWIVGWIQS